MFLLSFLFLLFPAIFILLVGLGICRSVQRGACAILWTHSLIGSYISAYLAASSDAPGIWIALALGAPLVCVVFAVYSRFAQPSQARESETPDPPLGLRRWKIATLAIALLPVSCIVIAKFQMTQFDASVADCKQAVASALIANKTVNPCKEPKLTCSAPNGFSAPMVTKDSLFYTGTLVGQGVFLDAHLHAGEVLWECRVFPKIFGNSTCQGYEVGWH